MNGTKQSDANMKLHVMYDESGRILAAVRLDRDGTDNAHQMGRRLGSVRPVMQAGQLSADLDVPPEYAHLTLPKPVGSWSWRHVTLSHASNYMSLGKLRLRNVLIG